MIKTVSMSKQTYEEEAGKSFWGSIPNICGLDE